MSLTPQIRRPWGHRVQDQTWPDLPMPQIVIWGALEPGYRVLLIRDLDAPDNFCTAVPADASPIQSLYVAEKCPAFVNTRVLVARRDRFLFTDRVCFQKPRCSGRTPSLPVPRQPVRWQSRFPACLRVLRPRDTEDLWPVTEVVVHSQRQPPQRMQLPFEQSSAHLLEQVRPVVGVSANSVWRLPTHCPAEVGCPLHLFLFERFPWDPWNDPADDTPSVWGLFDVRRTVRPPHPGYVMLELPAIFDFQWVQNALATHCRESVPVAAAYMGDAPITTACSPWGAVPLITVFPRARFTTCVPGMTCGQAGDAFPCVHLLNGRGFLKALVLTVLLGARQCLILHAVAGPPLSGTSWIPHRMRIYLITSGTTCCLLKSWSCSLVQRPLMLAWSHI